MRARIQDFHRRWLRLRLRREPSRCKRVHRPESFYTSLCPLSPPPPASLSLPKPPSSPRRFPPLVQFTTKDYSSLLPYPILSCPAVQRRPLHTLVRNRNICRNLYSYLSRHARTLTHCTTWWRAHLSLLLKNLCACIDTRM